MKPDPSCWMPNWPYWEIIYSAVALPALPWEVILSTCFHSSVILPLKLLTLQSFGCLFHRKKVTHFVWLYVSLEACHQHSFENDFMGPCLHAQLPKFTSPATVLLQGLGLSVMLVPLKSLAYSFTQCSVDCLSQEDSSFWLIWLNYYAGFAQREGMSDTLLNDQPPFLMRCLLCVCQLFLH